MRRTIYALSLFLAVSIPSSSIAAIDPQAIDLGTFDFIPTLSVKQSYDDNIWNQPRGEQSSWITNVSPALQFIAQDRNNYYAFTYTGDYAVYWDDSDDNYDDHNLSADFHLDLNAMNTVDVGLAFGKLHDNRGEGASEGLVAESRSQPDEYDVKGAAGTWAIGRPSAQFGVELDAAYTDIEYTNNRTETRFRDRDETGFAARFYGRAAPKTRFFVEYAMKDIDYSNPPLAGTRLDNDEKTYSVGAEWEATARTTGAVKIGRTEKDFDAANRGSSKFTSWDASVSWAPRTYSEFLFAWSNLPRETNGTGNFIESNDFRVTWTHGWSSYLRTVVSVGIGEDEYDNNPRKDDRQTFSVSVDYDLERWISLNAGYDFVDRDSNVRVFEYEKNVFWIGLEVSL